MFLLTLLAHPAWLRRFYALLSLIATDSNHIELQLEEIPVAGDSHLVEKDLRQSGIRQELGLIIVGIKHDGKMISNPEAKTIIEEGHILITLGETQDIQKLELVAANHPLRYSH